MKIFRSNIVRIAKRAVHHGIRLEANVKPVNKTNKILESVINRNIHAVSLKEFTDFGSSGYLEKEKLAFNFLRMELPARIGVMVTEFDEIPCDLLSMPSAKRVRNMYSTSLQDLYTFHPAHPEPVNVDNPKDLERHLENFRALLKQIIDRHAPTEILLANAVRELIAHQGNMETLEQLQYFLDRFYMTRIGVRMQIRQHLNLYENTNENTPSNLIGMIDKSCNIAKVLEAAGNTAQSLFFRQCEAVPEFVISSLSETSEPITLAYPPAHLFHIGFELIKNAMRAVVETHSQKPCLPPVNITIAQGEEDITIKISDLGGGIPRNQLNNIWTYLFTTADRPAIEDENYRDVFHAPVAGFGYGLPLSRLYARYFGGDLTLVSVEGYGTDALVYLKRNLSEAREVIPRLDDSRVGNYQTINSSDWMTAQIYPRPRTL